MPMNEIDLPVMQDIMPTNIGEKHLACAVLVDISGSMSGAPMQELNEGLRVFGEVLKGDAKASGCVDVTVIAFNSQVQTVVPFCPAMAYNAPQLNAGGMTAMNEAIITGLDALEQRKNEYKSLGVPYHRPWMFLMTDGCPTDGAFSAAAKQRLQEAITGKKVTFFPMGIGKGADTTLLKEYNNGGLVLKAQADQFQQAFVWLSSSMVEGSKTTLDTLAMAPTPQQIVIEL